eukprot:4157043-Pyramimonas_sp.AAC.1
MRPAAHDSPTPLLIVSGRAGGDMRSVKNLNDVFEPGSQRMVVSLEISYPPQSSPRAPLGTPEPVPYRPRFGASWSFPGHLAAPRGALVRPGAF